MALPSYLPNGIWSNQTRWLDWQQSNHTHTGLCSCGRLSQLQPVRDAGRTRRLSSPAHQAPSLACQGKGTVSSLFSTLTSSHMIKSEHECLNNRLHHPHLFSSSLLFPASLSSPPRHCFFVKCTNAGMWIKSLGDILISISDAFPARAGVTAITAATAAAATIKILRIIQFGP